MEVLAKSADRNLLLELEGELDHHAAKDAICQIERAIDAALPKKLVLDMERVTFMDSSRYRADPADTAENGSSGRLPAGDQCSGTGPPGAGCRRHRTAGDHTISLGRST